MVSGGVGYWLQEGLRLTASIEERSKESSRGIEEDIGEVWGDG